MPWLDSPIAYAGAVLLGLLLGSFANVCILRIPAGQSIVRPASHCTACSQPLAWYDNLPVVSYLVLRGRCRRCGARFSARYLFVELAAGLLVGAVYYLCINALFVDDAPELRLARFSVYTFFALTLLVISLIDLDHQKIPDKITYPGIPFFLLCALLLRDVPWYDAAIGLAAGYLVVRAIADGFYYLTKREGMGYGDGKLLALIGALLGWRAVLFALFGGALLGSVIGVTAIVVQRARARGEGTTPLGRVAVPFGPFLAAAALVYVFVQHELVVRFAELWGLE